MSAGATRPRPPTLEPEMPPCPLCGSGTDHDGDSFVCYPCGAYWNDVNSEGAWLDDGGVQCPKVITHSKYPILSGRCLLTDGHYSPKSDHKNGDMEWRSELLKFRPDLVETDADSEVPA